MKDFAGKSISKKQLAIGSLMLVICYAIAVASMVMMIVVNAPETWQDYFRESAFRFLSACICVLLLFAILFYYYYFEDKAFLAKARNVFLIYLVLIIAVLVCYFFGRFVSIYLRPVAMLALIGLLHLHGIYRIRLPSVLVFRQHIAQSHTLADEIKVLLVPLIIVQSISSLILAPVVPSRIIDVLHEGRSDTADSEPVPPYILYSVNLFLYLIIIRE